MVQGFLFVSLLTLYPLAVQIFSRRRSPRARPAKKQSYLNQPLEQLLILCFLTLLEPTAWQKPDFNQQGRGFQLNTDILSGLTVMFLVPLIMTFFPRSRSIQESRDPGQVFGFPIEQLPSTSGSFALFAISIVIGVAFEELFFRQFVFFEFYHLFGIRGDWLVLISTLLFTFSHSYTKPLDITFIALTGLILGKIFQASGTILYPMVLHLCLNATLIVHAIRSCRSHRSPH